MSDRENIREQVEEAALIREVLHRNCSGCGNEGSGAMFDHLPPGNGNSLCRDVCDVPRAIEAFEAVVNRRTTTLSDEEVKDECDTCSHALTPWKCNGGTKDEPCPKESTTHPSYEAVREALAARQQANLDMDNAFYRHDKAAYLAARRAHVKADTTLEAAIQRRDAVIEAAKEFISTLDEYGMEDLTTACAEHRLRAALATHDGGEDE